MAKYLTTPLTYDKIKDLRAGDEVYLTGTIYTARDAGHKRLVAMLDNNQPLPFDLQDSIIYYVGPTPTKPGQTFGSAGPTTSYRMDAFTPQLINHGLTGMIGKGKRSKEVVEALTNRAIYFAAIGGIAAIMGKCVVASEVIAFEDLDSEALRRLEVENMPLIVVNDTLGQDLYEIGQLNYLQTKNQRD